MAGDVSYRVAGVDNRKNHVIVVAEVQAPCGSHRKELVVVGREAASLEVRMQEGAAPELRQLHDTQSIVDLLARIERKEQAAVQLGFGVGRARRQQVHAPEGFERSLQRVRRSPAREAVRHERFLAGRLGTDINAVLTLLAAVRTPGYEVATRSVAAGRKFTS
jgi:hypothetical protein